VLNKLWFRVESESGNRGKRTVDNSLIYEAIYFSRIPSTYSPHEYSLLETGIHRSRDSSLESRFLGVDDPELSHLSYRIRKKLAYFFDELNHSQYNEKIHGGALNEFMDEDKLTSNMTQIAKRLVLMRVDESLLYSPEKTQEIYRAPWSFERLMLATKLVGVPPISLQKPLMIFDESLLNEVDLQEAPAFEEIEHPAYYLTHREKILKIKLKFGKDVAPSDQAYLSEKAPSLHINLDDYISLRSLTRGVGNPVMGLLTSTNVKIQSFMRGTDGFVDHCLRPIMWNYLNTHIESEDASSILVRTLGADSEQCEVKIRDKELIISQDSREVFRSSRRQGK